MSIRAAVDHIRYRHLLDAYVDRELADHELTRRVAEHVDRCPLCRDTAHTTRVVKHRLSLRRFLPTQHQTRVRREES
jgi:predicted anti-sigma-YlaC factor YlaD